MPSSLNNCKNKATYLIKLGFKIHSINLTSKDEIETIGIYFSFEDKFG